MSKLVLARGPVPTDAVHRAGKQLRPFADGRVEDALVADDAGRLVATGHLQRSIHKGVAQHDPAAGDAARALQVIGAASDQRGADAVLALVKGCRALPAVTTGQKNCRTNLFGWLDGVIAENSQGKDPRSSVAFRQTVFPLAEVAVTGPSKMARDGARLKLVKMASGRPIAERAALVSLVATAYHNSIPGATSDGAPRGRDATQRMLRDHVLDLIPLVRTLQLGAKVQQVDESHIYFSTLPQHRIEVTEPLVATAAANTTPVPWQEIQPARVRMTDAQLVESLQSGLLSFGSGDPGKTFIYYTLAHSLPDPRCPRGGRGIDVRFLPAGGLGNPSQSTPEEFASYVKNLGEKGEVHLRRLDQELERVRLALALGRSDYDPRSLRPHSSSEDSGISFRFETPAHERAFLDTFVALLKGEVKGVAARIGNHDHRLLDHVFETGFPGPNLKPLQQCLAGGFPELMGLTYEVARLCGHPMPGYTSTSAFLILPLGTRQEYRLDPDSTGTFVDEKRFRDLFAAPKLGTAVNLNHVMIPDDQQVRDPKPFVEIRDQLLTMHSSQFPASFERRAIVEKLQDLLGSRVPSAADRARPLRVGVPRMSNPEASPRLSLPHDVPTTVVANASVAELERSPDVSAMDQVDLVVVPDPGVGATADDRLETLLDLEVTTATDPAFRHVAKVVDNRSGAWDQELQLLSRASATGRVNGDFPYVVANNTADYEAAVRRAQVVRMQAPAVERLQPTPHHISDTTPLPMMMPNDGRFTVFVAAGHATEYVQDLDAVFALGWLAACEGWRLDTGAGSGEGGMGATHSGWLAGHLAGLNGNHSDVLPPGLARDVATWSRRLRSGSTLEAKRHLVTKLVLQHRGKLQALADCYTVSHPHGLVPRGLMCGTSIPSLLLEESADGLEPVCTTYVDAGTRARRLQMLLSAGCYVNAVGGHGTGEELHRKKRIQARALTQPAEALYSDGTPNDKGRMIIYNPRGVYDPELEYYGFAGGEEAARRRELYRADVPSNASDLLRTTFAAAQEAEAWNRPRRRALSMDEDVAKLPRPKWLQGLLDGDR